MDEPEGGFITGSNRQHNNVGRGVGRRARKGREPAKPVTGVVLRTEPWESGNGEAAGGQAAGGQAAGPVARRVRAKAWSHFPDWAPAFLAALSRYPNVTGAAKAAGISTDGAYDRRKRDEEFAAAWDVALAASIDNLEQAAFVRAYEGSDRLMELLLKAHKSDKYGDRRTVELTGANGGPVQSTNIYVDTDEEKQALKAAIRRELARRGETVD